ncbi:hypothetical protein [Micromonospora sp. CPCC 206061]
MWWLGCRDAVTDLVLPFGVAACGDASLADHPGSNRVRDTK